MSDKPTTSHSGDHLDPNVGAASGGGITDSPLHGPTLSTSTSSFEALDPHDPNLSRLATKMFQKTNEYVEHELNTCHQDYRLLENLNRVSLSKYSGMNQIAENLLQSSNGLKMNFEDLMPQLEEIDEIEQTVLELEKAAYTLDAYSQRLEMQYNSLMKKK